MKNKNKINLKFFRLNNQKIYLSVVAKLLVNHVLHKILIKKFTNKNNFTFKDLLIFKTLNKIVKK